MTKKIRIIDVLSSDNLSLIGGVYEVKEFNHLNGVETVCGRHFCKGEYEIISEQEAI